MKRLFVAACLALLALPATAQQVNIALVPIVSAAAEASHVIKASPGRVYSVYATNATATAGKLILLNQVAAPTSNDTVAPLLCVTLPASGTVSVDYYPTPPAQFSTGIVAAVSSNASCFTFTSGTITAFIGAMAQ